MVIRLQHGQCSESLNNLVASSIQYDPSGCVLTHSAEGDVFAIWSDRGGGGGGGGSYGTPLLGGFRGKCIWHRGIYPYLH